MRPNRIYIDVTQANLDDIQAQWYEIQEIQNRLGVSDRFEGTPPGYYRRIIRRTGQMYMGNLSKYQKEFGEEEIETV
jgi:hypothetical protein